MTNVSRERWVPVAGYEDVYEISDRGRVRRAVDGPRGAKAGHVLSPGVSSTGHAHVALFRDGRKRQIGVHRLVAIAFLGAPRPGQLVCHNDGNPLNNALSNLRWDSQAGNIRDSVLHGTHRNTRKTECLRGHPLSGPNLYQRANGRRECRTCILNRKSRRESAPSAT